MIINTGNRTDIPAYYSEWFYNRIRDEVVLVRNPYFPDQITRYRLSPDVVDLLVFCTKNPEPMLGRLEELAAFRQFWYVTITPYGKDIEPGVPDKGRVMEAFKRLSGQVGIRSLVWRYDPIFISEKYPLEFHVEQFERMAQNLAGYTDQCVISFIDLYEKTRRNFPEVREVEKSERLAIGEAFAGIGKQYGIQLHTCCEGTELESFGIDCTGCMSREVLERGIGMSLHVPGGKHSSREGCNCLLGNDIGVYNTCRHGCLYCYANYNQEAVRQNSGRHNPRSPLLVGDISAQDVIHDAKQETYIDGQLRLFF